MKVLRCTWCCPATLVFGLARLSPPLVMELGDAEREAVRLLANQAAAHFESGDYEQAFDKFALAYPSAPVPRLAVWLARTSNAGVTTSPQL